MAHFAKLDENNIVLEVNVVENDNLLDSNGVEQESLGVAFLTIWSGGYTNWKQTSYNGSFRKNYAGVGYVYDSVKDAFIPPQPFPSWSLNEEACLWEAPIEYPFSLGLKGHYWDESTLSWIEVTE
jgi:hypothetical protein